MIVRHARIGLGSLILAIGVVGSVGSVDAAPAPPPTIEESGQPTLIPVPAGCPVPQPADVVFVGTMIGKDDVTQVVRFEIDQLRAGSASSWAIDGLIDVRYGDDYRFLDVDQQYLVGAGFDPVFGSLVSTVRPSQPTFGGNDVIGVDDIAVTCPAIDDPIRTLNVDGTTVDSGVLSLLTEDRRLLLSTLAVPAAIVFVTLLALVVLKLFGRLALSGVWTLGRAAVTPVPDHRAVRIRSHRSVDDAPPTETTEASQATEATEATESTESTEVTETTDAP